MEPVAVELDGEFLWLVEGEHYAVAILSSLDLP